MSYIFVLYYKLQEKLKAIHSINCKYLSMQSWSYYFTQMYFINDPKKQDVHVY